MRLCLVSDTHRHRHELLTVVKSTPKLDAILHAGDEVGDVRWLKQKVDWPIYGVAGNWDRTDADFPYERILDEFGPTILLTHGHQWKVKEGLDGLAGHAKQVGASVVVYGHTHVAVATMKDGIIFVNPGSLAVPRGRRERTYAVLDAVPSSRPGWDVRVGFHTAQGVMTGSQLMTFCV